MGESGHGPRCSLNPGPPGGRAKADVGPDFSPGHRHVPVAPWAVGKLRSLGARLRPGKEEQVELEAPSRSGPGGGRWAPRRLVLCLSRAEVTGGERGQRERRWLWVESPASRSAEAALAGGALSLGCAQPGPGRGAAGPRASHPAVRLCNAGLVFNNR